MKEKKSATPITWEELERKAQSKLAPYFEIRSDSGDLLVCAQHEKAPECNFKTNDIGEAINAIADEGLHKFVFIRFMSTPSARTNAQPYVYMLTDMSIDDINFYWQKEGKEQGLAGGGNGGVNPMWYYQQTQALAGQREKNFMELWQMQSAISDKKSEALAGAMKAEILASTNEQILQVKREALDKEYTAKMQMLEESFKSKQELLDLAYKFREERLAEREARITKKEEELEEREAEVKEKEDARGVQYKEVVTSLGSALPDVISNWAGINLKTAQPLKGKENGNDQPNPEAQKAEAQRKAKQNMRSWRNRKEEETEPEPQNTPE